MGLEPTTLRDLVGCSNHWATGDSMVSEGQFVGLDWNRIARLHSQVLVSTNLITSGMDQSTLLLWFKYSLTNPVDLKMWKLNML